MTQEQKSFIERVGNRATVDMKNSGILASLTIAQAILESGWGKSGLAVKANALFGIKATSVWRGKVYNTKTQECFDGVSFTEVDACFRAYDSWEESINDHSTFLRGAARYAAVVGECDYKKACTAIKAEGYATDPDYPGKLIKIIEQHNLTAYDKAITNGGKTLKILLDPGHFGKSNNSPANPAYWESEAMWKLCGYLKAELESYGITVGVTRTDPSKDKPVFERGTAAKGYDLFISLHSNAVESGTDEATDYPVVIVPLNKQGDAIGNKLAAVIEKTMKTKQKGRISSRAGTNGADYYGVIRGAVSVGVVGILIEHSFHTQKAATNWLLQDANLRLMAKEEAAVIAEHYGMRKGQTATAPATPPTPSTGVKVGDMVQFTGGNVYTSSNATTAAHTRPVSRCKVTQTYNGKHPYHLVSEDGKGVYGWVDANCVTR